MTPVLRLLRRLIPVALLGAVALSAAAFGPQAAQASRAPTTAERKAILAATIVGDACAKVRVSTKAAGWAVVTDPGGRRCGQERSILLRRTKGVWEDRFTLGGSGDVFCPLSHVPTRVARDLGLCKPPPTLAKAGAVMLCMEAAADINVLESQRQPAACNTRLELTAEEIADGLEDGIQPEPPEPGANLSGLTWSRWGSRRATATGIDLGFGATPAATPVTVVATRPRFNECGRYTYTLVTITYPDATVITVKNPARCVI